jgi:hypothetical protein
LGDINTTDYTDNKFYSNLSFTSEIADVSVASLSTFSPMYYTIKSTEIDLNLSLYQSIFKWKTLDAITYITDIDESIDEEHQLVKGSVTFSYWITSGEDLIKKTATISEDGTISGEYIENGSFDYDTNTLTVTFLDKIQYEIITSYEYYYSLDLDYTKPLSMNYKIEKSIKINEIGLEDENHELMAYMTFPDVEFHTIYNDISAMFAIRKE